MIKTFEEFIKSKEGKQIGFGELTPNRVIIYAQKYFQKIIDGKIKIEDIKPKLILTFEDKDAIPFEMISLKLSNDENFSNFFVGESGDGHSSLINMAFKESPLKITNLPSDWKYNAKLKEILNSMSFSYGGRLWKDSKLVVLKSDKDFEKNISQIYKMLKINHIDISDYHLLICKENKEIDEKYWGDIILFEINDILKTNKNVSLPISSDILHHKYKTKYKKLLLGNGKEMTMAEYNSLIKQENLDIKNQK